MVWYILYDLLRLPLGLSVTGSEEANVYSNEGLGNLATGLLPGIGVTLDRL